MSRLRIGVLGAGLIAQVEHIPNLLRLAGKFQLVGVSDPSAMALAFIADRYGVPGFATADELLAQPLDAVLIALPDALHHEHVLAALAQGLHVFCEKPLCYGVADIDEIIAARDKAGKIVQVGYMKRFDPGFQAAIANLPGTAETLRHIAVEVHDPDSWPFVRHHAYKAGTDVPAALIEQAGAKQRSQAAKAVPVPLDDLAFRGFTGAYCSSLVHDVNAVHGLLGALAIPDGEIVGAEVFAGGAGGQGTVRLLGGQALWNMTHVTVPGLADYRERITLAFDNAILDLDFPSPYLNHQPAQLTIRTSDGHELRTTSIRAGYEEAFVEELIGFWSAITEAKPVRNLPEHARRDQALLCGLATHFASRTRKS